jgi:hypothetical protein
VRKLGAGHLDALAEKLHFRRCNFSGQGSINNPNRCLLIELPELNGDYTLRRIPDVEISETRIYVVSFGANFRVVRQKNTAPCLSQHYFSKACQTRINYQAVSLGVNGICPDEYPIEPKPFQRLFHQAPAHKLHLDVIFSSEDIQPHIVESA